MHFKLYVYVSCGFDPKGSHFVVCVNNDKVFVCNLPLLDLYQIGLSLSLSLMYLKDLIFLGNTWLMIFFLFCFTFSFADFVGVVWNAGKKKG